MDIYRLTTNEIEKTDITLFEKNMPERMKKAERYKYENDRLLCIGGGYLIWNRLKLRDESELKTNEFGKLYADGYPDFSISHSGKYVVFAATEDIAPDSVIGIDIEEIRERNTNVARKVFTEKEMEWMKADPLKRFHILWTRKESVMKALGKGFSIPFKSFEVVSGEKTSEAEEVTVVEGRRLYIRSMETDGYMVSVCSSTETDELSIKRP